MAPPNISAEMNGDDDDDDDICVLIYRESQLRKAEAAAATERKRHQLYQFISEGQLNRRYKFLIKTAHQK